MKELMKPLAIALALPSLIFVLAYLTKELADHDIISAGVGFSIFTAIIIYHLILMVYLSKEKK